MGTETHIYEKTNEEIRVKFKIKGKITGLEVTETGIKITTQVEQKD